MRALNIGFNNKRKNFRALAHVLKNILKLRSLLFGQPHITKLALTEQRNFTGLAFIAKNKHFITGQGNIGKTKNFSRYGRACRVNLSAVLIEHGAHATKGASRKQDIPLAQRA